VNCTEDRFLHDVREHAMEIIRDDGVYRHIRFKRPGAHCQFFDLVTWPGDMGTFVFSRLHDMFDFFRTDRRHLRDGRTLGINPCYWSEKLIAVDGNRHRGSAKQFSEERFRQVINEQRIAWLREARQPCSAGYLDRDDRRDLWGHDFTEYTFRFLWCCYALAWGIQRYDAERVR
jgi:hypothetical protein